VTLEDVPADAAHVVVEVYTELEEVPHTHAWAPMLCITTVLDVEKLLTVPHQYVLEDIRVSVSGPPLQDLSCEWIDDRDGETKATEDMDCAGVLAAEAQTVTEASGAKTRTYQSLLKQCHTLGQHGGVLVGSDDTARSRVVVVWVMRLVSE
jgi:hypothetical protein